MKKPRDSIGPPGNRDKTRRPDVHHLYPLGNAIFGTSPFPAWIFGPLILGALALLFVEESRKFIVSRFTSSRAGRITQQTGPS